ncbi:MAG TPA: FxSxx-COOH system tetratricopeptide repeat protein [Acidobacteriota bacterium]|nr:FxSxx-COOH system tetratricopeptide repeat protein [Acidobacteriota bacterium]
MPESPSSQALIEVFYSYSHKDEELRDKLETHLSILKRAKVITDWHDRRIGAGKEWKGQIDGHLNTAQVILLLISADFLASHYCYDIEMMRALERHEAKEACVIPVILRAVDWSGAPFGELQALPKDAKPVTSWDNEDEAFTDVARGIRAAVEELVARRTPAPRSGQIDGAAPPQPVLPKIWNVPHRNLNFTGRAKLLTDLHNALTSGIPAALTQAISGLGGIGKTQLAKEYAYRHASDYRLVWWIQSEEGAKLASDFADLARELNLPEKEEQDQRVIVAAVCRWLNRESGWLLIFDNVPHPKDVTAYLPKAPTGHVIVTSRDRNWGGVAAPLQVMKMDRPDAIEFLLRRTGKDDKEAANKLAEMLGDFPLLLEQAASYMIESGLTLSEYADRFRDRREEMLKRGTGSDDYDETTATVWELSFQAAEKESEAAAQLLYLCAFLAPDDIPCDMIAEGAERLPEPLATTVKDALAFDDAVAALHRYSLVEKGDGALSLHRLVQAVTRDRLLEDEQEKWLGAALMIVNLAFPQKSGDVRFWPQCARLLPHATTLTDHHPAEAAALGAAGRLLNQAALYLKGRAELERAKDSLRRAVVFVEKAYGPDHPDVATAINNMGEVLRDFGDPADAMLHCKRALAIDEKAYGPDHPDVGRDVNNLGLALLALDDLPGAKECLDRALVIIEKAQGPDHPMLAAVVINVGEVLRRSGDLAGAKECVERGLAIDEKVYGLDHPEVAVDASNLAAVLVAQGDFSGAKRHLERALAIFRNFLGDDHPSTMTARKNLESLKRNG